MKQLVQNIDSGEIRVVDVPAPAVRAGGVRVRVERSLISIGTERTKLEFGRKTLVGKALERPDQVRKVLESVAREGVAGTYRKVRGQLDALSPMGYSCAGVVEAVGAGVTGFSVGDRVACAGAGYANHAERVWVPRNLVVPVPDAVSSDGAAFATLGAIALQGVRQADARLGENVVVIGLGLLGQLTMRLVAAAGARPLGVDLAEERVALAERLGGAAVARSADVEGRVESRTGGVGADAVIITAATSSTDPIRLAGELARDRGRVVVVGAVPIDVPRSPYYEKELDVRLSRSYGPGRYDPEYEEKGHDYPIGYVRWTERRNMAEFLRLLETGAVALELLITHRFPFADAVEAYERIGGEGGAAPGALGALGVLLEYPSEERPEPARIVVGEAGGESPHGDRVGIGLIGAGTFATGTLLPILEELDVALEGVVTATGLSARSAAENHGFRYVASSPDELLADPAVDAVVIATRHDRHAALTAEALRAGKAVFVEKPLALDDESLDDVLRAAADGGPLMVGFNRRFAPATRFVRQRLERTEGARVVHARANAGAVPPDHWVHDPEVGGGRLIGEGCHFIDLALYLIGSPPAEVHALALAGDDPAAPLRDNVQITVRCGDGSLASVLYTSKGDRRAGKERIEVFAGGVTGIIDDFRRASVWGAAGGAGSGVRDGGGGGPGGGLGAVLRSAVLPGREVERWKGRQDKGHAAELEAFVRCVREGGEWPIPLAELAASSRATLDAARALHAAPPASSADPAAEPAPAPAVHDGG